MTAENLIKSFIDSGLGSEEVRKRILNLTNSEYVRASNQFITEAWQEFNKAFPS